MAPTSKSIKAAINGIKANRSTQSVESQTNLNNIRSFQDIPTKRGLLPAQLALLMKGGPGHLHEHCDRRHRELGPIYREHLGSSELVFIADTKMIRTTIANEGSMPHHNVPEAWLLYNQMRGLERGLFFQLGEPWLKLRRVFNKVLLAEPKKLSRFTKELSKINGDLLESWASDKRKQIPGGFKVDDIKYELCKWSIEATGLTLFGERLGCVPSTSQSASYDERSKNADDLVRNVAEMFEQTANFQIISPRLAMKYKLNCWKRFVAASDGMLKVANQIADEFLHKSKQKRLALQSNSDSSEGGGGILDDLLATRTLGDGEISRSLVDLIIAGADTTSNALQWIIHALAKHPEVQRKLHQEIQLLKSNSLRGNFVTKVPYCEAVIREVFRLFPTAPFLARTLDHTIILGGYEVPAGVPIVLSLFTTSRMNEYFDQPLEFKPERWVRNDKSKNTTLCHDAIASLPFGIGSRMCIARRMAELEMNLLVSTIVDSFELSPLDANQEVKIKLKMVLGPDRPISINFKPRIMP